MRECFDEIMQTILEAEPLGSRRLANGAHLIGHVPHVAPEAYFHVVYAPLDDSEIAMLEQQVQRKLPSALKEFYKLSNGMDLFAYALAINGHRSSYARTGDEAWQPFSLHTPNILERPSDAGDSDVFFGAYEWDGSLLGMSYDSPSVYRCSRDSAKPLNEWESLADMLTSEVRRLAGLFDKQGRKIDKAMPTVPP